MPSQSAKKEKIHEVIRIDVTLIPKKLSRNYTLHGDSMSNIAAQIKKLFKSV